MHSLQYFLCDSDGDRDILMLANCWTLPRELMLSDFRLRKLNAVVSCLWMHLTALPLYDWNGYLCRRKKVNCDKKNIFKISS